MSAMGAGEPAEADLTEAFRLLVESLMRAASEASAGKTPEDALPAWRRFYELATAFDGVLDGWVRLRAWTKEAAARACPTRGR